MRLPSHSVAGIGHIGNRSALPAPLAAGGGCGAGWTTRRPVGVRRPASGGVCPVASAGGSARRPPRSGHAATRYRDPVQEPPAVDVERARRPWRRLAAGVVLLEALLVLAATLVYLVELVTAIATVARNVLMLVVLL